MPKSLTLKDNIDDALRSIYFPDFAGLNSEADPTDIKLNEAADCQNVRVSRLGRLIRRDGYSVYVSGLAAKPDGVAFFYDSAGYRRLVVFANGALYDCTTGAATLIQASCYTAGNRVTSVQINSKLYFSDGETISSSGGALSGIWYWDPIVSASAATLLLSNGAAGTIPTPAAKVLSAYTGCLVLGRIRYTTGEYDDHAVMWGGVNDPTRILGTNIFHLGQGQGGYINAITPMGVGSQGVAPYQALFVGKSQLGVYQLKGALSPDSLSEILINVPTGVLDGDTVKFIPGPESSGYIVWLGSDARVYYTNGISGDELSQPIRSEVAQYVNDAISQGSPVFSAVRNFSASQYVLDVGGGIQYCFDWLTKTWTRYSGWPSGLWCEARSSSGQPTIYCADRTNNRLSQCDTGSTDNGTAINPYWTTGYISAGDPDLHKLWQWVIASFATDSGDLKFTATCNQGGGGSSTVTFTTSSSSTDALWDAVTSIWDTSLWSAVRFATYQTYKKKGRLTKTTAITGIKELLGGYDIQIKVEQTTTGTHFELLGFDLLYLPRGRKKVAAS